MGRENDIIFKNGFVAFTSASEDLSSRVSRVRISRTYERHDNTRMGDNSRSVKLGLYAWQVEMEMIQTFASTDEVPTDKIISAKTGLQFAVAFRPFNAARSSDNPEYRGNVVLAEDTPIDGEVGALLKTPLVLVSAGDLTRVTTSS